MLSRLVIIGAGGQGKVAADIALRSGYKNIIFFDGNESINECDGFPVLGKSDMTEEYKYWDFFVAIGNSQTRQKISEFLEEKGCNIVSLIHPNAVIGRSVKIGNGTAVMAGAVINPGAKIGKSCIINTCSSVDHDCDVGDYVHIAVGSHLCGTVTVGDWSWIGAGATVSNNIQICCECTVGAGALVIKNIDEKGAYVGVPARKIK